MLGLLISDNSQLISDANTARAGRGTADLIMLGFLAGAYISFAGAASTMAAFNLLANPETFGLGRCLAGVIFPCGLVVVVLAGAELFTGNTMMLLPLVQRRITFYSVLRNWGIVYVANLAGAVTIAFLIFHSGQLNAGDHLLGGTSIRIAALKCNLPFMEAFLLGIFCNWLVCLAIWMAIAAKDVAGKILAIFFPIWVFVTAGFEHSIANMFFIPVGLFAAQSDALMASAETITAPEILAMLTWENFFVKNLLPVTLGNTVSGGIFVALVYGYIFRKSPTAPTKK
jgi:formate/nitrite transporter